MERSNKTQEGIEVKVGQQWRDEEGFIWDVKYSQHNMIALIEAEPAYPKRTLVCGIETPELDGWTLIKDI